MRSADGGSEQSACEWGQTSSSRSPAPQASALRGDRSRGPARVHVLTLGAYEEVDREAGIRAPLIALKGEGINGEVRQSWSVWGDTSPRNRPETTMNHLTEKTPAPDADGIDRRGFLECMTWAGTGVLWSIAAGLPHAVGLEPGARGGMPVQPFTFLQISDSHVGFDKPANPDALATLREAVDRIKALPGKPAFMIHTGDISHLSKDKEFDDAEKLIQEAGLPVFYVPGEHDLLDDEQGKSYLARFGRKAREPAGTASTSTASTT